MSISESEWRNFTAGVRMYKGKNTFFYNGEILWEGDDEVGHPLIYDWEERDSWKVIIILPGVEIIPELTFRCCRNVETLIMADTVRRIEDDAFWGCRSLKFVKLSRNLEYIGAWAFATCESMTSIFIPQSCVEIDYEAFWKCKRLIIFSVPQHTRLGRSVIHDTALKNLSPFKEDGQFPSEERNDGLNAWLHNGNINMGQEYSLHRAFASQGCLG